jgi:hypothetical protein
LTGLEALPAGSLTHDWFAEVDRWDGVVGYHVGACAVHCESRPLVEWPEEKREAFFDSLLEGLCRPGGGDA